MNITIAVDRIAGDPMVDILRKGGYGAAFSVMTVEQVISGFGYAYRSDQGRFVKVDESADWLRDSIILNRAVEISRPTCVALGDGIAEPSRGVVCDAYKTILSHLGTPPTEKALYSTVGVLVPLFTQWKMYKKQFDQISTPSYKYGYGPEEITVDEFIHPIYKSPFNLYDWRPNDAPEGVPFDTFVVDRPPGRPMAIWFFGSACYARWLDISEDAPPTIFPNMERAVRIMASTFSAHSGESLWFVDGQDITFASFSHRLEASQHFPETPRRLFDAISRHVTMPVAML